MNKVILSITALLLLNMPVKAQNAETINPEIKALYTTTETDLRDWMSYLVSPECRGRFLSGSKLHCKSVQRMGIGTGRRQRNLFPELSPSLYRSKRRGIFQPVYTGKQRLDSQRLSLPRPLHGWRYIRLR